MNYFLFLLIFAFNAMCCCNPSAFASQSNPAGLSASMKFNPPEKPIGKELFSLNLIGLQWGVSWPKIPFYGWRNFHSYWDVLEPAKGKWNFEMLDREVALGKSNKVDIMLVLGSSPTWASARPVEKGCCSQTSPKGNAAESRAIEDWRTYVKTVATRYKGRVHTYELWNEPNHTQFYSGTVKKLVELNREAYRILKEVDPSNIIVSSSISMGGLSYLESYLAAGGGKYADVIGYHFYVAPRPPEAMVAGIKQVKELMIKYGISAKPLWNTETGWNLLNHDRNETTENWAGAALSDEIASAYILRSYILSWAAGLDRFYWYSWGHRSMGMTEYDVKTPKPIAKAFTETQKWLVGARMVSLQASADGTYLCTLNNSLSQDFWIVWNPRGDKKFPIPAGWNVHRWRDLAGEIHQIGDNPNLKVGESPLLLER